MTLVIRKGRLTWFGHAEHKDDTNWIKHCIMMEVKGMRQRGCPTKTRWDNFKKNMKSFRLFQQDAQIWNNESKKINGATG